MATTKPRLSVMLEPETYELLRELSELQGESMSKLIAGVLEVSVPVLVNLRDAGRRYERLSASAQVEMANRWQSAEAKLLPHVREIESEWLGLVGDADPRPVTRGSRPPRTNQAQRRKGAGK